VSTTHDQNVLTITGREATPADGTARPTARARFRAWRRSRPFWGGLVTVLAGLEMFFSGQMDFGHLHLQFGIQGMQAMVIPLVLVLLGILAWAMPVHRVFYGVIALVLSVYSLIGVNLGGFLIGMILGIVGAVMTVSWLPVQPASATSETGETAEPADADVVGVDGIFSRSGGELPPTTAADASGGAADATDTAEYDAANPPARGEPSAPRPFFAAAAGTEAQPAPDAAVHDTTVLDHAAPAKHRMRRTSALGIGLLASTLSAGLMTSGALPAQASQDAGSGVLCVLDPLHLVCPAGDPAPDSTPDPTDNATVSPTAGPTSTATSNPTTAGSAGAAENGPAKDSSTDTGSGTAPQPAAPAAGDPSGTGSSSADATGTDSTAGPSPSASPSPTTTPSPSPTPSPTASNPYAPGATPGPKLKATSGQPVAPDYVAHLTGSAFKITSSFYVGNVTLKRADGSSVTAMKFTADKAVVPDFRLEVPIDANNAHGLLATSDSITLTGHVVLYATKFTGTLVGLVPLTFTPDSPPPSVIPLPSMTDVKIEMVTNTADSLSYDNPHQSLY
jgi:hypothetical protein